MIVPELWAFSRMGVIRKRITRTSLKNFTKLIPDLIRNLHPLQVPGKVTLKRLDLSADRESPPSVTPISENERFKDHSDALRFFVCNSTFRLSFLTLIFSPFHCLNGYGCSGFAAGIIVWIYLEPLPGFASKMSKPQLICFCFANRHIHPCGNIRPVNSESVYL